MINRKRFLFKFTFLIAIVTIATKCSTLLKSTSVHPKTFQTNISRVISNKSLIKLTNDLFEFNLLTDYDNIKSSRRLLKQVVEILHENNLEYIIVGGTLLGAIKNKGMLAWDDDNDIALMETNMLKFVSLKFQFNLANINLTKNGFFYKLYDLNGKNSGFKNYKYPFVDVFFLHKKNGNYLVKNLRTNGTINTNLFKNYYFKENEMYPLRMYEFEDFKVYGPQYSISYLNRIYSNWQRYGKIKLHFQNRVKVRQKTFKTYYYNANRLKPILWLLNSTQIQNKLNVIQHCSKAFDIIELNKANVFIYLPELNQLKLSETTRDFLISFMILYKYGGLFIDSTHVSVLNSLVDVVAKLKSFEFVGFGCSESLENKNTKECLLMSRHVMASRPKRILLENIIKSLILVSIEEMLTDQLVELVMKEQVNKMIECFEYDYYQYNATLEGLKMNDTLRIINEKKEIFMRITKTVIL